MTNVATLTFAGGTQTARIRVVVPNPFACPSNAGPSAATACAIPPPRSVAASLSGHT
jgi:hypothetical protein